MICILKTKLTAEEFDIIQGSVVNKSSRIGLDEGLKTADALGASVTVFTPISSVNSVSQKNFAVGAGEFDVVDGCFVVDTVQIGRHLQAELLDVSAAEAVDPGAPVSPPARQMIVS